MDSKFYDDRYRNGYMKGWPIERKQRIFELITGLNLPETGEALDYGCGNGEFTKILKLALPKWNVYGTDISSVAIDNAKKRHVDCSFFLPSDIHLGNKRFDFLFTHHVLEHVEDIDQAWREIDRYLKNNAGVFTCCLAAIKVALNMTYACIWLMGLKNIREIGSFLKRKVILADLLPSK